MSHRGRAFATRVDALSRKIGQCLFWLLLALILIGAFNALARYAGARLGQDLSSNRYLEAQWYLFSVVFLLGGAYTMLNNGHVRVDVFYDRLSRRARSWIDLCGHVLLTLPFCVFAVWMSLGPVIESWRHWEDSPNPEGLYRFPIKTLIPIAFALLILQVIAEILKHVQVLRHGADEDPA
jgi:TRAP-type mannitol/chloroaromatic compound transport system permease small subunit